MPSYKVTDPQSGKTVTLTGDSPPTETELTDIFAKLPGGTGQSRAVTAAQPPSPSFGQRVGNDATAIGNFLGIQNLPKGASQALATPGAVQTSNDVSKQDLATNEQLIKRMRQAKAIGDTRNYERFRALVNQNLNSHQPDAQNLATNGEGYVTPEQVAGSTVNLASLTGLGLGGGANFASRVGQGALMGAVGGAGGALNANASAGGVAKGVGVGAVIGAAVPALLEGISAGLKGLGNKAADYAYNSAVQTPANQILSGKEELAQGLKNRGIAGSYKSMQNKVQNILDTNGPVISQEVQKGQGKTVAVAPILKELQGFRQMIENTGGSTEGVDSVTNALTKVAKASDGAPTEIPVSQAQELKQQLGKFIGNKFYKDFNPGLAGAQETVYNGLNQGLNQALGSNYTKANAEYSFAQRVLPQLLKGARGKENIYKDIVELGASHFLPGAGPLAATENVLSRPFIGTPIAQGINKVTSKQLPPEAVAFLEKLLAGAAGRQVGQSQ